MIVTTHLPVRADRTTKNHSKIQTKILTHFVRFYLPHIFA